MKQIYTLMASAILAAPVAFAQQSDPTPVDFNRGIMVFNEGQFGKSPGSLNFLASDGTLTYRAYQGVNEGRSFGNTLDYADVFGDLLLVASKQAYDINDLKGGRVVVADAATLEYRGEITDLPESAQANTVCAVSPVKAYVGTSKGLYTLDMESWTIGDTQLAPQNEAGKVQQTGVMLRYGNMLFVAQQNLGVLAVDPLTDNVTVIDLPKVSGLVVLADGSLYASTSDPDAEFVMIDRDTYDLTPVDIEGSHCVDATWTSWRKPALAADTRANRVYFVSGGGFSPKKISAYDFDTAEFTDEFFVLTPESLGVGTEKQMLYGQGMSVDPASGNLVLTTNEGYTDIARMFFVDVETAEVIADKTVEFEPAYWFTSLVVYPDFSAPEIKVADVILSPEQTFVFNPAELVSLPVGNPHLMTIGDVEISTSDAVVSEFDETTGIWTLTAVEEGSAEVSLSASYEGREATASFTVTVDKGDDAIHTLVADTDRAADVYTPAGVLVRRAGDTRSLPAGIYITAGRKLIVR